MIIFNRFIDFWPVDRTFFFWMIKLIYLNWIISRFNVHKAGWNKGLDHSLLSARSKRSQLRKRAVSHLWMQQLNGIYMPTKWMNSGGRLPSRSSRDNFLENIFLTIAIRSYSLCVDSPQTNIVHFNVKENV